MTRVPKVRTSITIDPTILEQARQLALLESKSFSGLVESCLRQYIGKQNSTPVVEEPTSTSAVVHEIQFDG